MAYILNLKWKVQLQDPFQKEMVRVWLNVQAQEERQINYFQRISGDVFQILEVKQHPKKLRRIFSQKQKRILIETVKAHAAKVKVTNTKTMVSIILLVLRQK